MLTDPAIKTAIGALLEAAINKALEHDPATRSKLAQLQGCVIHLACQTPKLDLVFIIEASSIRVSGQADHAADVTLSGAAGDFFSLVGEDSHSLANANISVSGKVNILHQIKAILSDLDIDWEDMLAQIIGVMPAHLVAKVASSTHNWGKQVLGAAARYLPDYLSEELKAVPTATELEIFYDAVDDLKSSTQRLEARLHDLAKRAKSLAQPSKT